MIIADSRRMMTMQPMKPSSSPATEKENRYAVAVRRRPMGDGPLVQAFSCKLAGCDGDFALIDLPFDAEPRWIDGWIVGRLNSQFLIVR